MLIASVNSSTGAVKLQKKAGATYTDLATGTATWPQDTMHRLGFRMAGNVATVTVDGATIITHTLTGGDITTFAAATSAGLLAFDTTTRFDNLTISNP